MGPPSLLVAELGPTNTGKTFRAIERMLEHDSGMIGLPLRLLAREVYDRVTARVGEARVALVTGEEKRVPSNPSYWICTVEAMPVDEPVDFLAVDEIQLCAHRERGHVFTEPGSSPGWSAPMTSMRSRRCPRIPKCGRSPSTPRASSCSGTSAAFLTSGRECSGSTPGWSKSSSCCGGRATGG